MTKDSIIEQALMRIKVTDGTNQIGEYLSDAMDEYVALINKEPVTFLLSNALRHLTQDQQRQLCNALLERLPVPASLEQEAERLYPDTKENETVSMGHNGIQDLRRSVHITAARQYMDTIDKLRAENLQMRDALQCIVGRIEGVEWEGLDMVQAIKKVKEYATSALKTTTHG